MNTVLIPLDFSAGTHHVLDYIAAASRDIPIKRVILLKSLAVSIYQPVIATAEYMCLNKDIVDKERQEAMEHMNQLTGDFLEKVGLGIQVDKAFSELSMPRAIIQTIKQEHPDLLMLHSSVSGDEGYIGQNLIELVTISKVPVMVIPQNTRYRKIKTAMIPLDFGEFNRLTAFHHPLIARSTIRPSLKVFSIKKSEKRDDYWDRQNLAALLEHYAFTVHYTENDDILQGILDFAEKTDPELIVALPGKYNFLKKITHRSITRAIAHTSNHPVLILKQP